MPLHTLVTKYFTINKMSSLKVTSRNYSDYIKITVFKTKMNF